MASRLGFGLLAVAGVSLALAGIVAAQDAPPANKTAPAAPPSMVTIPAAPGAPAIRLPSNALIPPEVAPTKPETTLKPALKAETPPPMPPKPNAEPLKRPRFTAAVLQGVDKITAETLRFEARVGEPVRYKGLILTVRACETTAADEDVSDSIAHIEVVSQPVSAGHVAGPARQVFKGWMYANGPALHPFEHSIYDLWLIACKTASPKA